jgi:PQQ-dependent dehydrogenase (methanol/ethanol family)
MNRTLLVLGLLTLLAGCDAREPTVPGGSQAEPAVAAAPAAAPAPATPVAAVDDARIRAADAEPHNWMSHGRTYDEQRFSPLEQINTANVAQLGLDWFFDFPTNRGMEATPIVVDGRMFVTSAWSHVYAFDARTGALLWHHDPEVPQSWGVHLCCDAVNRGVAVWAGRVYAGTIDGRLIALDAADGRLVWSQQTTPTDKPYSITGAPRVVKGLVIIGNGGAELGVRGFVSAYDAVTGEMKWRFYTVPGDPSQPFESEALARAAETWKGGEWWRIGGGGTVWDSMAYDPELDLLYVGVGNGSPWNTQIRSPGGGDNLYLSSILALRPETGEYVWHYQTTPGETWDYTATQHMILADLPIGGVMRKVIMQAPKNGFFYVLDRATGEFISAEAYALQTWAKGIDATTGRPIVNEEALYRDKATLVFPAPHGAHNWHPMSFSPKTGLVYLPVQEIPFVYKHDEDFRFRPGLWNVGVQIEAAGMPEDPAGEKQVMDMVKGRLVAWDPVAQKERWRVDLGGPTNGGVLSTAGGLVFEGAARGEFVAYDATDGKELWSTPVQTGAVAAPISYAVDGKQYVALVAGWGGAMPLAGGKVAAMAGVQNRSRLLVYSLDGKQQLPEPAEAPRELAPPPLTADAATVARGKTLYAQYCSACHGDGAVGGGVVPDLRYMSAQTHAEFDAIALGGLRHQKGMVGFANVMGNEVLAKPDTDAIHAYLVKRAHDLVAEQQATAH